MPAELWLSLLAILVLIAASAFFSGSETALTAASRTRMHQRASDGDVRALRVEKLTADRERLIGSILLGNNAVNILSSSIATSVLIGLFGDAGVAMATLGMTLLLLIFAEILPKTVALHQPDRLALALSGPLTLVVRILGPFSKVIGLLVRGVARVIGIKLEGDRLMVSADDLRGAIRLYDDPEATAAETRNEKEMLASILDLGDLTVGEIMIHRRQMTTIDADQPPAAILAQVTTSPHTRLPMWQGDPDNVIGVLHAKDMLRALTEAGGDVEKIDVPALARTPWFIPDSTTLHDQLHAFRQRHAHFALVIDEYGTIQGLVTLEDILEEIVGEIVDEHDIAVEGLEHQADGGVLADGTVTIRDLNRETGWRLPDDEATTIAGLVIHEAKAIPEVGQRFRIAGIEAEVLRRHRNRVTKLRLSPIGDRAHTGALHDAGRP
ncbi:HlyC/CorC family transporter [Tistrella mobilis]|uniref:HlyC/CorC family transporter n=1 Tax=Tistrella mobilis TaxID=171437 RepID=UPI0035583B9A